MKIKVFFLYTLCSVISCIVAQEPAGVPGKNHEKCVVRAAQDADFPAIEALGVKTFTHVKKLTALEDIKNLEKVYKQMVEEDKNKLSSDPRMVSAVALCNGNIIGFLAANDTDVPYESYVRTLMVDPVWHNQGIAKALVRWWLGQRAVKRAVCLTNKKNEDAQKLYTALGGKKVEHPSWSSLLYSSLSKDNFVGYEFDEKTMATLKKKLIS